MIWNKKIPQKKGTVLFSLLVFPSPPFLNNRKAVDWTVYGTFRANDEEGERKKMFAMYSRQTREQKESQREEEKDERERTESQSTGREMSRGNARRSDNHASPALRSQRDQKRTNLVKNERGEKKGRAFLPTEEQQQQRENGWRLRIHRR